MAITIIERTPLASSVSFSNDEMTVALVDGRRISVPLAWFPRLSKASQADRENYELLGDGDGIHWPAIDEDISIAGLMR